MDYDYCSFRREAGLRGVQWETCQSTRKVRNSTAHSFAGYSGHAKTFGLPGGAYCQNPTWGGPFDCGNLVEDGLGMEDNLRWVMMNEADTAGRVYTETAGMDTAKDR